ncbi:hypothetical protein MCOR02_007111 [Pyricularia oryzae]|nr:hypothetical protein MCOR02_007111 [Pyricularia oryzae]
MQRLHSRVANLTRILQSKDHFTNVLNSCAGRVASTVLQYVVPRVLFAWDNPGVPVDEVVNDVIRAFHHPAARNEQIDIQKQMFETVRKWSNESHHVIRLLSSESVKAGKNHVLANGQTATKSLGGHDGHAHGPTGFPAAAMRELGGHGKVSGSLWSQVKTRDMGAMSSGPSGAAAPPEPDYSTRPQADTQPSYNQPAPPATYGYGQPGQPQSYGQPQGYQPQHQQHPPQPAYGSAHTVDNHRTHRNLRTGSSLLTSSKLHINKRRGRTDSRHHTRHSSHTRNNRHILSSLHTASSRRTNSSLLMDTREVGDSIQARDRLGRN